MNDIISKYKHIYGQNPELFAKAPARINIIGEHIDYTKGHVLPAAINRHMNFAFSKTNLNEINIYAADKKEYHILTDLKKNKNIPWANYFIGILVELEKRGIIIRGFNLVFGGNIPIGGGLSSSSALECGFLKILNKAYQLRLTNDELIEISKASNHSFLGLQGGIMDQYAILHAKKNHALLLNCKHNSAHQIPLELVNHELVLINSKVSHSLVDSAYNERVEEGNEALSIIQIQFPEVKCLSAVTRKQLNQSKHTMSSKVFLRAKFTVDENKRVHHFCTAMQNQDYITMGQLLYQSHKGLKDEYEVSCEEIDLLIDFTHSYDEILGARMIGGGFGGCTLNLIKSENSSKIIQKMVNFYQNRTGIKAEIIPIETANGVVVFNN